MTKTVQEMIAEVQVFSESLNSISIEEVLKKQKHIFELIDKIQIAFTQLEQTVLTDEDKNKINEMSIEKLMQELERIDIHFNKFDISEMSYNKEKANYIISVLENKIASMKMSLETVKN